MISHFFLLIGNTIFLACPAQVTAGFVMTTSGSKVRQYLQNVLYAADRCSATTQDSL